MHQDSVTKVTSKSRAMKRIKNSVHSGQAVGAEGALKDTKRLTVC